MDNSMALNGAALGENDRPMSRKKFLAGSGAAVLAGGLIAQKSATVGTIVSSAAVASQGGYLSKSFVVTLDQLGKLAFQHGLGASLPANILSVNAFIKLPDGKVRSVAVNHVDDTHIAVAAGVPHATVKVGVIYSEDDAAW